MTRTDDGSARHESYRRASEIIERGWIQRDFGGPYVGGTCLVGALERADKVAISVYDGRWMPKQIRRDLHGALRRYPSFWIAKTSTIWLALLFISSVYGAYSEFSHNSVVLGITCVVIALSLCLLCANMSSYIGLSVSLTTSGAAQMWNDAPWRRKQTVVAVLNKMAESYRPAWLEDDHLKLSIELSATREKLVTATAELERLRAENGRLLHWLHEAKATRTVGVLEAELEALTEKKGSLA